MKGHSRRGWLGSGLAVLALAQAACVTQSFASPSDMSVGPALSVESFLRASNARDLDAMARLFGTPSGPVANTGSSFGCMFKRMGSWIGISDRCARRQDIEIRMNAIAMILAHEDYRLGTAQRVPGRDAVTTVVPVALTMADGREATDVPFMCVQTGEGQWLIQEIGLDKVTSAR